ncbi:MAG: hypothetical protein GX989_04810 [Firmicutes bacterium]|nr:hypothetical protein [Bacillota bacterium]
MENLPAQQALVGEIKREILSDLNRTYGWDYQRQQLIDNIKQEVLMELGQSRSQQQPNPDKAFIDAVKNEVLAKVQGELRTNPTFYGYPGHPDRATIDSIKKEVIAQLETEREAQGVDPALVQAVKNSVLAEMNVPYR